MKTLGTQWTVTLLEAVAFFSHLETKQSQVLKCTLYSPNKARQAFVSHISLQYFKAIPCHKVTLKKTVSHYCVLNFHEKMILLNPTQLFHMESSANRLLEVILLATFEAVFSIQLFGCHKVLQSCGEG